MKTLGRLILLLSIALTLVACEDRDQVDSGGVILTAEFTETITTVSVNATSQMRIQTMTVNAVVADPNANSSELMDVELEGYEVTFSRADGGARLPPALVRNVISLVPINGAATLNNFPLLTFDQLRTPPLSDLLFENGGFDKETGLTRITLDIQVRFFGRTVGGKNVSSVPNSQTTVFTQ